MTSPHLEQAADSGELPPYRWEHIPPDTPQAILDALGGPVANRTLPGEEPVRVVRAGKPVPWPHAGELVLEDGTAIRIADSLPADLPWGYHDFHADGHRRTTRVIVTPRQCPVPTKRQWGWTAQIYGVRSRRSWGIGDMADLDRLAAWSAGLGAGFVLVNPLAAAAPVVPQVPSPYHPSSRCFRNPLYIRVEDVPGAERLGPELEKLAAAGHALNHQRQIDRDRAFQLKDQALRAIWAGFEQDAALDRFCHEQGAPLLEFATFCVLAEQHGGDWTRWPAEFRHPQSPAVQEVARQYADRVRYHQWLQWLVDQQLARASRHTAIVHDLPVGMSPQGADAWLWQDMLALDMSIGAPPDAFASEGQNWALPPFVPCKLRATRYEPFIQTIRATLRHAGGLRIDHVMGLFRLWWVPQDQHASQGTYVRYPADDLLGIVALESQRAGAFVVGEDLGTVEPGVRERLAHYGVLSFRVLYFEPHPPPKYPRLSMATVSTHDLPTIAGLWSGWDLTAQQRLGLPIGDDARQLRQHFGRMLNLPDRASVAEVTERAYGALAEAPSLLLGASLEDALAVPERPNMPSTMDQWPNWTLALPVPLEALEAGELPRCIANALCR
jgi:4-alpha-glucanotransferase